MVLPSTLIPETSSALPAMYSLAPTIWSTLFLWLVFLLRKVAITVNLKSSPVSGELSLNLKPSRSWKVSVFPSAEKSHFSARLGPTSPVFASTETRAV